MKIGIIALIIVLTLMPALANSEPQPWMKKAEPTKFHIMVLANSVCASVHDELQEMADNALVRARIENDLFSTPGMRAMVLCMENPSGSGSFFVHMRFEFSSLAPEDEFGNRYPVRYGPGPMQETIFYGGRQKILEKFRDQLEQVMSDYVKANFELGD